MMKSPLYLDKDYEWDISIESTTAGRILSVYYKGNLIAQQSIIDYDLFKNSNGIYWNYAQEIIHKHRQQMIAEDNVLKQLAT
jgi:hypothetical protein